MFRTRPLVRIAQLPTSAGLGHDQPSLPRPRVSQLTTIPGMSLSAAETADATAIPILEIGRAWMMSSGPEAQELGFAPGFDIWVNGRAGALGEVSADVAAGAIGFMAPALVARAWSARPAGLEGRKAAMAYADIAVRWGRSTLADLDDADLVELTELANVVIDAALPSTGLLFAGWRELDAPTDPAGSATHALQVLRELRGGAHLSAIQSAGLTPQGAIISFVADDIRGGPNGAERFGWSAPHPDPDPEARSRAEAMTTAAVVHAYESLPPERRQRFVDLVLAARAAID